MSESPDAFAAVTGLIALVTDAKACAKRIDELRKLTDLAVEAQAKLAAERAEFDQRVAVTKAELDERGKALDARRAKLAADEGMLRQTPAAAAVEMPTNRLRDQLKLPHVRRYVTQERGAFIDALCAGNPAALKEIRDTSKNATARVAAVRQAEIMKQDADNPASSAGAGQHFTPGLVVIIQGPGAVTQMIPPPQPALIDVTPKEEPRWPYQHEP